MSGRLAALSLLVVAAAAEAAAASRVEDPADRIAGLVAQLRSEPNGRARQKAVMELGRSGRDEAVGPLVDALHDEWVWVRAEAVTALGRFGGARAAAGLVGAFRDSSRTVRLRARRAVAAIGPPAVAPLATALADQDAAVRWPAAWALGQIGDPAAARALEAAEGDPDWRVRNELAAARRPDGTNEPTYPETLAQRPTVASPTTGPDGTDLVVMLTREGRWALVPASPREAGQRVRQLLVDAHDFPTLARTGLHSADELARLVTITGRSLAEIDDLGRPGGLSVEGFLAEDEETRRVLEGDDRRVRALGLTHPQLALPLFHVWNVVEADAGARRWNMARHRWERCRLLLYNGREIQVEAHDTKGGQESIFDDGLEGAFWIEIRRTPSPEEESLLRRRYGHLPPDRWAILVERLTSMQTGEIEPHYVQWYGFYEGHTAWRVDPVAIAFLFGLRSLEEIEAAFPGQLEEVLTRHFTP